MDCDIETPFGCIESAQEYLALLVQAVLEAKQSAEADLIGDDSNGERGRRLDAMRLAWYKLDKLEGHIKRSRRLLNDLRTLRRLLLDERRQPTGSAT